MISKYLGHNRSPTVYQFRYHYLHQNQRPRPPILHLSVTCLTIWKSCTTSVWRADFISTHDTKLLAGRYGTLRFQFKTAMKNADAHHRKELSQNQVAEKGIRATVSEYLTLWAALEWSYTPPKKAVVASLPICLARRWRPPGCSSMKEETSWMNPDIRTSGRFSDCVWTRWGWKVGKNGHARSHVQLSQLITGKSLESWGHWRLSCVRRSFLSSMVSWPFLTSFSGKLFRWLARPSFWQTMMNHLVGSYWYHLIAFR